MKGNKKAMNFKHEFVESEVEMDLRYLHIKHIQIIGIL